MQGGALSSLLLPNSQCIKYGRKTRLYWGNLQAKGFNRRSRYGVTGVLTVSLMDRPGPRQIGYMLQGRDFATTPPPTSLLTGQWEEQPCQLGDNQMGHQEGLGASCLQELYRKPAVQHLETLITYEKLDSGTAPSCQREEATSPCGKPDSGASPHTGERVSPTPVVHNAVNLWRIESTLCLSLHSWHTVGAQEMLV